MEPWTYTDGDSGELLIDSCNPGEVTVQTQGNGSVACVMADDLPEVVGKLYEACGQQPPVILGRPATSPSGTPTVLGTIYPFKSAKGARVAVGRGTGDIYLEPGHARELAAILAAYADAAEPEPDPADVDALAAVIRHELHPDSERIGLRPGESDRTAARAALRWMRDREARDA